MIRVFIGYDPNEIVAYHVCAHSILSRASMPVQITPINLKNIPEFKRARDPKQSTEFAFSRFLTPYLSGYTGQSIFMDCDMLVRCDLAELIEQCDLSHDVFVVKHDYIPKTKTKFLGQAQSAYPRKNWSSVMVFNNFTSACKRLTPEVVSEKTGSYLHRFQWCQDERIGELDKAWNHLVGEYTENSEAKIVHFTLGTPCFDGYQEQEYSDEWFKEYEAMTSAHNPSVQRRTA